MKTRTRWIAALVVVISGGAGASLWLLRPTGDQPWSFIEDGVYLGSSVEQPPPGTQAVVNLCGRPDPYPVGPSLWAPIYEAGPGAPRNEPTLEPSSLRGRRPKQSSLCQ